MDAVNNFKKNVNATENLKKIIDNAEIQFNKKLNRTEVMNMIGFIKTLNFSKLFIANEGDIDKINIIIINIYKKNISQPKHFDIHEYMKDSINNTDTNKITKYESLTNKEQFTNATDSTEYSNTTTNNTSNTSYSSDIMELINKFPNLNSTSNQVEFTKIFNYTSLLRDSNILIDSRYQNVANTDRSKIPFTIVSDVKTKVAGSGIITSIGLISNIFEIEIFPFSIPYISQADNYYKKITLSILELSSISIDAYEDSQFHFMFTAEKNKNLIDLIPINNIFRFYKPIAKITNFTLRFGSPLNSITFDKDRLYTSFIDYTTNPGLLTFPEEHNLISGDIIYINDFSTNDNARDLYIINEVNDNNGHLCTRVSATSISININLTALISPNTSLSIEVYFGSKRILMPMRIRYMSDGN